MAKNETFTRYFLIIKKLKQNPASFEDILQYLRDESVIQGCNFMISKRTFERDKAAIYDLFNIEIVFDSNLKCYTINQKTFEAQNQRLFEAFGIFNALQISERLSDYLHFEDRNALGIDYLMDVINAIKNRKCIEIEYQKFWEDFSTQRLLKPLAVKEHKNRWYIVATEIEDDKIKSFGLDRVIDFQLMEQSFDFPHDFNINNEFEHTFGIINSEVNSEKIQLKFTKFQGKYIKTKPIHSSQKILEDTNEYTIVQLHLKPTYDLVMEILSYGNAVEVISPQSLRKDIKKILNSSLKKYK
ncbi:MAG: helix-turn-helix transcriptional regulator [Psychroflexus sp.]